MKTSTAIQKVAEAHKLQGRMKFQGMDVSIENKKGSVRRWYDPHGKETGSTKMYLDYGYIRGTLGTDGDHVDVYVGPQASSDKVFVINQSKKPEGSKKDDGKKWAVFDEQKVMLGFDNAEDAKAAYLKQYDDPRFFGNMKEMSMADFRAKVLDKKNHGKKVAELVANPDDPLHTPPGYRKRKKVAGLRLPKPKITRAQARQALRIADQVKSMTEREATNRAAKKLVDVVGVREKKSSDEKREGHIAERLDDLGIGILAAPYAARGLKNVLGHRKGVLGAVGQGAGAAEKVMHKYETPMELTGLALVAPGVTNALARGIGKLTKKKQDASPPVTGVQQAASPALTTAPSADQPTAKIGMVAPPGPQAAVTAQGSKPVMPIAGQPPAAQAAHQMKNATPKTPQTPGQSAASLAKAASIGAPMLAKAKKTNWDMPFKPPSVKEVSQRPFSAMAKPGGGTKTSSLKVAELAMLHGASPEGVAAAVVAGEKLAGITGVLATAGKAALKHKKPLAIAAGTVGIGTAALGAKKAIDVTARAADHSNHRQPLAIRRQTGMGNPIIGR